MKERTYRLMNEVVETAKELVVRLYVIRITDQGRAPGKPSSARFIETELVVVDNKGQEHSTSPLIRSLN